MDMTMKNVVNWLLRSVALIRTDVWEECTASIIRVAKIGELGATQHSIPQTAFFKYCTVKEQLGNSAYSNTKRKTILNQELVGI
jgi:demethoxyubiquinone hydroxylase (CLK1/Coq7/Cat5 family)